MKQLFIFSLPRSGSTLLQRILMSHSKIASISEPWIMLPQIYSLRSEGQISEYSSLLSSNGLRDLVNNLPNKEDDYYNSLKDFINSIHNKLSSKNEIYFLDKTPRYYLIIEEIRKVFPEAKFVFLFRSPEQIYSSMIKTWANNKLRPFYGSYFDLTEGFDNLSQGYLKLKEDSIALKYEELVTNPEKELVKIMDYLELNYEDSMINAFVKQDTKGSLGDPTGINDYKRISNKSLEKWKETFNSKTRKVIAYKTINKISEASMSIQGYNKKKILFSINSLDTKFSLNEFKDIYDYHLNKIIRNNQLHLVFGKKFKWTKSKFLS